MADEYSQDPAERRDRLMEEVRSLRGELRDHVADEGNVLMALKDSLRELGSPEEIRLRRVFIEAMLKREEQISKLRTSVIEKSVIGAVWVSIVFIAVASWHEVIDIIRAMLNIKKGTP